MAGEIDFGEKSETGRSVELAAMRISKDVCGGVPRTRTGWKAKIYSAAVEASKRGIEEGFALAEQSLREPAESDLKLAASIAVHVLMARLPSADFGQRAKLRGRIAAIRSGTLNTAPEVQSALLAIERCEAPQGRPAARSASEDIAGADAPAETK